MQLHIKLLLIVSSFMLISCSTMNKKEQLVQVTGSGTTKEQAVENALDLAVQECLGILIVNDQQMQNGKLVVNFKRSYSGGFVSDYEIIQCSRDEKIKEYINCMINAVVTELRYRNYDYIKNDTEYSFKDYSSYSYQTEQLKNLRDISDYLKK